MVKYSKNFDSLIEEMNNYWGEDDLIKFVENLLGPPGPTTNTIVEAQSIDRQSDAPKTNLNGCGM